MQGDYRLHDIGDFELEEGGTIPGLQLAYATYGELSPDKDNAILIPTWFSGTHQTWEQAYIGAGRALDPERWFIVVVNQIGNGLSTSPHNSDGPVAMAGFPHVRIGDDVRAQEQLLRELFGIERLALVVGGSMGAQQTYEWMVRFPNKVLRAAPIAGTAQNTPHDFLFTQTLMDAITSDPGWKGGEYSSHEEVAEGLRRHAGIWSVVGFSTEFWKTEFWRGIEIEDTKFSSMEDFQINFMEAVFGAMDPNALLTMAWKWQRGDVRPQHRRGPAGGPRPGDREDVCDADRRRHVLPAARLRSRASDAARQRATGAALGRRPPRPVRLRAVIPSRGR